MKILILIITMLSCNSIENQNNIIPDMNLNNPKRTFLALGDSYTIGESVDEKDRWSRQLIDLLKIKFNYQTRYCRSHRLDNLRIDPSHRS